MSKLIGGNYETERIDTVYLEELYRQKENSYIPVLAREINDNEIKCKFKHPQSHGYLAFNKGDEMNLVPIIVDKEPNGERSYDIFSRLLKDRIIFISGEIDDNLANTVVSELLYLDSLNNEEK